jgi:hypothetical protein
MFLTTVRVRSHERGLWFRHGEFHRLLEPGTHRFAGPLFCPGRDRFLVVSMLSTRFKHSLLDTMLAHAHVRDSLHVVDLTDVERALVWKDERLAYVLGPGRHAFWKSPYRLYVETFRVPGDGFYFRHPRLPVVLQHPDAPRFLDGVQVDAGEQVLLYRDGVLIDRLAEGLHVYWKGTGNVAWKAVDLREQATSVSARQVLTADRVALRAALHVTWHVTDPVRAVSTVHDYAHVLAGAARIALRAAIGSRSLDALLADKESVNDDVCARLSPRAAELGVAVRTAALRDLAVPRDAIAVQRADRPHGLRLRGLDALASQLRALVGTSNGSDDV